MQTPTNMLDPMLGKILTAKQSVESPSTTIDPHRHVQSTEPSEETKDSSTPAEVRLVVKFIVEEHTVYKGIVRKIKQLESEELSRVVSHIAWDGAKELDKASSEVETDKTSSRRATPEISDSSPRPSSDRTSESNNSEQKEQSKSPPNSNYATDDLSCGQNEVSGGTPEESQVQEKSESNTETSDYDAYVKCNTSSDKQLEENNGEENIVAQDTTKQEISRLNVVVKCDMTREQSSNSCEIDNEHLGLQEEHKPSIPPMIEERQPKDLVDDAITSTDSHSENANSKKDPDLIHDINGDSQSVTEALNDCVMNVDLESKRYNESCSIKSTEEELSPRLVMKQPSTSNALEHNGHGDHDSCNNSIVDPKTEEMIDLVNDRSAPIVIEVVQEYPPLESAKVNQALAISTNNTNSSPLDVSPKFTTIHSVKEDASCSIVKRKASSLDQNHSTGKRIRRASGHKEQRSNLNTRKSASKTLENASAKQNLPLDATGISTSPTTMNQPPQVFAKWSDNHFYPGYIIKQVKDRKFVISFLDGAQKDVGETDLIPLRNIVGKQVRVTIAKNYCYNAIVHEQAPPLNEQPQFDVEYQSNNGSTRRCVSWKDIFLTAEQGTPLINQVDKISGASNFADVDLDNIIYEKRSRRIQDMEEFYFTGSSPHRTKTSLLL